MEKLGVKVAVIGGGTGSFTLLNSLKFYTRNITALVNMADDGGSTGQLRDELGVLPPGDVRQCLVALSHSQKVRDLFNYRFQEGGLKGHAFGNLFLTALEKMTGNFAEAVEGASEVLNIVGRVEPITLDPVTLMLEDAEGKVTKGEFKIGHLNFGKNQRPKMWLEPRATLNPKAAEAIKTADLIVIAPGNLYGSLAPALIVDGLADALKKASGKIIYVCNLVTKPGQTDGFTVNDFAAEIERFMNGAKLDYVLYNNQKPSHDLLDKYAADKEFWIDFNEVELKKQHYKAIGDNLVSSDKPKQNKADKIASSRSFIRHDADRVARQLMKIYFT